MSGEPWHRRLTFALACGIGIWFRLAEARAELKEN